MEDILIWTNKGLCANHDRNWSVKNGLQIDKYLYSPEDYIKAGALLACGIVNTGVRNGRFFFQSLVYGFASIENNSLSLTLWACLSHSHSLSLSLSPRSYDELRQ
jgi:hypothetical protein